MERFNQNADITLTTSEDIALSYICKDAISGEELTEKTTNLVFIEPSDECVKCAWLYIECGEGMCSFYNKPCKEVEECYQFEEVDDYE